MVNKVCHFFMSLLCLSSAFAINLGVHGQIYPIAENDFFDLIQDRYLTMKHNGEWHKLQEKWSKEMEISTDRPKFLNISTTVKRRTYTFDPTVELKRDIIDPQGRLLIKAGSTVNPLKIMPLSKVFLFINGDDEKQIKWAKLKDQEFTLTKWILVNGSISETIKKANKPVFFDQWGKLVHHFNIQHVPAFIKQEGNTLKIEECVVP